MSKVSKRRTRPASVSRALAKDRLGVTAVLFFVLADVAPLTVAAGVIPAAYQITGLTGIPAAFLAIAVILAIFAAGYVAMARHIQNAGAFVSQGIGEVAGAAAALVALLADSRVLRRGDPPDARGDSGLERLGIGGVPGEASTATGRPAGSVSSPYFTCRRPRLPSREYPNAAQLAARPLIRKLDRSNIAIPPKPDLGPSCFSICRCRAVSQSSLRHSFACG